MKSPDLRNLLPSVQDLLEQPQLKAAVERLNRSTVTQRVRSFLDELRDELRERSEQLPTLRDVVDRVTRYVTRDAELRLVGAINATGRLSGGPWVSAPLADAAVERQLLLARDYGVCREGDLLAATDAADVIKRITGAEACAVFASRAGALSVVLRELAGERSVVVARGELGEVDPGCRVSDLCRRVGAQLHEVGATNGVTAADYQSAHGGDVGALLRIVADDYRLVGEATRPAIGEVAAAARALGAVLVEDLSGAPPTAAPGLDGVTCPAASDAVAAGADLVLLRGDGLLGGPACCLAIGKRAVIDRLMAAPDAALHRPTAATVAGLAATAAMWEDPSRAVLRLPLLAFLTAPLDNLRTRAERLAPQLADSPLVDQAEVIEISAEAALPTGLPILAPTVVMGLKPAGATVSDLAERMRAATPPVWGRVTDDRLLLDLRTVFPRQDLQLLASFSADYAGD